jgi:mono/diheme cytochrome c family protein
MTARPAALALGVLAWAGVVTPPATAAEGPVDRGRTIAKARCASCHAIGPRGKSPMAEAPPFRELPKRYPVEHLAEALAEGIVVGHPAMPQFAFDPPEIDALLSYLRSLGPRNRPRTQKR